MSGICLVTGASRGLGLSLVKRFLDHGQIVYGVSRTKRHWTGAVKAAGRNPNFRLHRCDLTSETQVKALVGKILRSHKRIDVLVNNAGYGGKLSTVDKTAASEIEAHFKTNLLSSFLTAKYVIPVLRKQNKGWILNISSMAGQRAVPKLFGYSAAKFGIRALTQAIAKENAGKRFKCVNICPGGMNTQMRADLFGKKDAAKQQSADFVAGVIDRVLANEIPVESGSDIVIRYGKITAINPLPGR